MICNASGCENTSAMSWQRYATAAELVEFGVPPDQVAAAIDDGATVMVYACEEHVLIPDLMAMTHQAPCPAPPDCTCLVVTPLVEKEI